jgi:hypothetical protein|tara:strand:+ start:2871 stop:3110 length:240 start_codon:yes stop_codon:yes gene_type:complete
MGKYESQYIIFDVTDGPKTITESINTLGKEGWWLSTIINVGGTKLCAWLTRSIESKTPDPEEAAKSKLSELWSDITGDD